MPNINYNTTHRKIQNSLLCSFWYVKFMSVLIRQTQIDLSRNKGSLGLTAWFVFTQTRESIAPGGDKLLSRIYHPVMAAKFDITPKACQRHPNYHANVKQLSRSSKWPWQNVAFWRDNSLMTRKCHAKFYGDSTQRERVIGVIFALFSDGERTNILAKTYTQKTLHHNVAWKFR